MRRLSAAALAPLEQSVLAGHGAALRRLSGADSLRSVGERGIKRAA